MAKADKFPGGDLLIPDLKHFQCLSVSPVTTDEEGHVAKIQCIADALRNHRNMTVSDLEVYLKELAYAPSKSKASGLWNTPRKVINVACERNVNALLAELLEDLCSKDKHQTPEDLKCIVWVLRCIVNLSSFQGFPTHFASMCGSTGLIKAMLTFLNPEKRFPVVDDCVVDELIRDAISAMYALSRTHSNCILIQAAGGVPILKHYLDSSDSFLQIRSLLTLANVVGESEGETLVDDYGAIPLILSFIEKSLEDKDSDSEERKFCWLHEKLKYFFYLRDLLIGLQKLSVMEKNKKKIVEANGLEVIMKVLKFCTDDEIVLATKTIWNLSFDPDCHEMIKATPAVTIMEDLCLSENKEVRSKARGLLWKLSEKQVSERLNSTGEIMLSYSWAQQRLALDLNKCLWAKGYDLWMDVEQMTGSTLEAMAGAIENCRVVLICFSSDYKESPSCRSEAEYTYKLRKPFIPVRFQHDYRPDGWLGMMIGARMYIDVTKPGLFHEAIEKLCAELGRVGTCRSDNNNAVSSMRGIALNQPILRTSKLWSEEEAQAFLFRKDVSPECLKKFLGEINGLTLTQLQYMQRTVPKYFYRELKHCGMTFSEIVKISAALNSLDDEIFS